MNKRYSIISDWEIAESSYLPEENLYFESIFTLGNGYMAARGTPDEGFGGDSIPGFYVAGVFDHYEDGLFELVSQPSLFSCRIFIDGNELSLRAGIVRNYSRSLNMKAGTLTRSFEWEFSGLKTFVEMVRFISLDNVHLAAAKYKLKPLNYHGKIEIVSYLDKTVGNLDWGKKGTFELSPARHYHFDIIDEGFSGSGEFYLNTRTKTSGLETAQAVSAFLYPENEIIPDFKRIKNGSEIGNALSFTARKGREYCFEKKAAVFTSRDPGINCPREAARQLLTSLNGKSFDELLKNQVDAWSKKWAISDIRIAGNPDDQVAVRFNIFHLIQADAENDPLVSIGGRLPGSEVFNGGVFWDTDVFVLPFFIYTNPTAAKNLLLYRYNTLAKAREKAEKHWLKGAMYPWTAVYDGREQCAFWEYANIEVHLNADIAYSVRHYYEISGDEKFLANEGLEILIETARFWESRFFYDKEADCYSLILVQGPDEYTGPVNNDTYTLIMAKLNLRAAIETIELCQNRHPAAWRMLKTKLAFDEKEIKAWDKIIRNAYSDYYDPKTKIYIQDEVFLKRIPIDPFSIKVPDKMLRFTMPSYDTLLRYQIVKQPSIILLMYLLADNFSLQEKLANWNYYEPKTIHDSSLSYNTHSIMASELGFKEKAYDYFLRTAYLDLNKSRDTDLGLHSACIGGTWQAIINGFAGMRLRNGRLDFSPSVPETWQSFSFQISYRGKIFKFDIGKEMIKLRSLNCESEAEISVYGHPVHLVKDKEHVCKCRS
ncbi:MAG: glycosyl hydrolase family 65 protein [Victivallaceae bacterium]|nr:glycosyl hydrolase family 65 protein [Victivallaceae bacterium]